MAAKKPRPRNNGNSAVRLRLLRPSGALSILKRAIEKRAYRLPVHAITVFPERHGHGSLLRN